MLEFEVVKIKKPEESNAILGQSHFIKTVEDLHEAIVTSVPNVKFGIAFCEASGPRLVRYSGNDEELVELARENAMKVGAGHFFIVLLKDAFPINVLNAIKNVQEVVTIYAASANPMEVIVAKADQGRAVVGVVDGEPPVDFEKPEDQEHRKSFLRKIGYKL
jgi:adenosine/AMP kinase